jgi:hypothetical protein
MFVTEYVCVYLFIYLFITLFDYSVVMKAILSNSRVINEKLIAQNVEELAMT